MGNEDASARIPSLDLTCRLCGAVVVACTTCGSAFAERARVHCRRESGHEHDTCVGVDSGQRRTR